MSISKEKFKEMLREKGLKVTNQRILVLEVLADHRDKHLTAEDIYELVREDYPEIGLATIYRTVQLLLEMQLVDRINLDDGCARYEIGEFFDGEERHHHHHLICRTCGKILPFKDDLLEDLEDKIDDLKYQIRKKEDAIEKDSSDFITKNEELLTKKRELRGSAAEEEAFEVYIAGQKNKKYDSLKASTQEEMEQVSGQCDVQKNKLVDVRMNYLQNHPKRDFSASAENNDDYDSLLSELSCNELEEYQKKAAEQAKAAVEHFKEDFVYKIRSAIKEAYVRRDELNRIIRNLNFGKDRYQFKITRNKGADGAFYDMFMDEDLDIDPSSLASPMEHQMNLFSMEHENKYGMLMSDLIHIFIPPENATQQELDEAKQNMVKYADYRTYLSFEMEQIVEGDERLVIGLSKMIKKNSGGEGQNPLYIALLASFAQAYHINLSARLTRRPTIRLVVLDEAFSKMDAEKVASCIELIRGLGFQAIISATNDKIQNYIENVDKTFVYANPNKKSISIQEFEKKDFSQLVVEEE